MILIEEVALQAVIRDLHRSWQSPENQRFESFESFLADNIVTKSVSRWWCQSIRCPLGLLTHVLSWCSACS